MLCLLLHCTESLSLPCPNTLAPWYTAHPEHEPDRTERNQKGRKDGGFCCSFRHVLRSGSSAGKGQGCCSVCPKTKEEKITLGF